MGESSRFWARQTLRRPQDAWHARQRSHCLHVAGSDPAANVESLCSEDKATSRATRDAAWRRMRIPMFVMRFRQMPMPDIDALPRAWCVSQAHHHLPPTGSILLCPRLWTLLCHSLACENMLPRHTGQEVLEDRGQGEHSRVIIHPSPSSLHDPNTLLARTLTLPREPEHCHLMEGDLTWIGASRVVTRRP